jgi:hypothetical protein
MAQAETRKFGKRTRTVIPVDGMKATQIMVVFDVQSKRTAHSIVNRGFYIVNYTKPAMCPGEIDMKDAYRIANWWLNKRLGGRLPHWAEPEDMIQDAVTRLIERGGDPRMAEASYRFYVVRGAMTEYLRRNQKHEHEDEEKIEAPGSRWGTWDRSYRATETMCRMIEAKGAYPEVGNRGVAGLFVFQANIYPFFTTRYVVKQIDRVFQVLIGISGHTSCSWPGTHGPKALERPLILPLS